MSAPSRPHLLLTNDDGIEAPGLAALAAALRPIADLTIVAPAVENSAMGHAISLFKDLRFSPVHRDGAIFGWGLAGTPADCVKVAVSTLGQARPFDWVISGINRGRNAGIDILYSGTVAAAREGAILGLPAIAISLYFEELDKLYYDTASAVAFDVMQMVLGRRVPPGVLLNVNVPGVPLDQIAGWSPTRMGNSAYIDHFLDQPVDGEEFSRLYRNIGKGSVPSSAPGEGPTDDEALQSNRVSITPLHLDLTAHEFLPQLRGWMDQRPGGPVRL